MGLSRLLSFSESRRLLRGRELFVELVSKTNVVPTTVFIFFVAFRCISAARATR